MGHHALHFQNFLRNVQLKSTKQSIFFVGTVSGELLVGPKKVLFLDEISTGLDSSTTFQITRTLRDFCHLRDATMLVALLQPTPETYALFDDILLMSEGRHDKHSRHSRLQRVTS